MLEGVGNAVWLLLGVGGVRLVTRLLRGRGNAGRSFAYASTHGRPSAGAVAAVLVGGPFAVAAPHSAWPVYVSAAAVGAFATGAIAMTAPEVDEAFGTRFYSLPGLRPVDAGSPGSCSAAGVAAATCVAFALPAWAGAGHLIGPGEAALIGVAALLAAGLGTWLDGRSEVRGRRRHPPAIAGALLGGLTAALLVAFLP